VTTRYAATVLYVPDPAASVDFYACAFGFRRRHLNEHENGSYAELETGATLIAFASPELVARHLPVEWQRNDRAMPAGLELNLVVGDVHEAYLAALAAGATPIAPPAPKPWGQTVGFVRDLDGLLVEIASEPS
jgi:lactoylglutathione lyase